MKKPDGKRPRGRPRLRRKYNGSSKVRTESVDWLGSGQEQLAGSCGGGDEPSGSIKSGEFLN